MPPPPFCDIYFFNSRVNMTHILSISSQPSLILADNQPWSVPHCVVYNLDFSMPLLSSLKTAYLCFIKFKDPCSNKILSTPSIFFNSFCTEAPGDIWTRPKSLVRYTTFPCTCLYTHKGQPHSGNFMPYPFQIVWGPLTSIIELKTWKVLVRWDLRFLFLIWKDLKLYNHVQM